MQVEPKKTNRPLPHGWKEKGLKKQLRAAMTAFSVILLTKTAP